MKVIPEWSEATIPSLTGIVITKAVERDIPDGTEAGDEKAFTKWDPDIIDDEIAGFKVRDR